MPSSEELVCAARQGDKSAFAELVRLYERAAVITSYAVLRDYHSAQDVAQDAFLSAFSKLDQLWDAAAFGSWLLQIARRRALLVRRVPRYEQIHTDIPDPSSGSPAPDWLRAYEDVVQQLARLPVKTRGNAVGLMVDDLLDDNNVGRFLENEEYKRYEAGDRDVNGRPCRAYSSMPAKAPYNQEFRDGKRRWICLFDDSSGIVQMVNEVRLDGEWNVESLHTMNYDEPIERTLFEPRFGDGVAVIDLDSAFEGFVDLDKAVHREERKGVIYAIHRVKRFENGGLFLISSVRCTSSTSTWGIAGSWQPA